MANGIFVAATGMLNQSRRLNITGNNLSNADTAGYKRDVLAQKSFGDHLTYCIVPGEGAAPIGLATHGVVADETVTQFEQGGLDQTGRGLDFAIAGDGFFTFQTPNGEALSRGGHFFLDAEGYLSDAAGNRVLGDDGPIMLTSGEITVGSDGVIYQDGVEAGKLRITVPGDMAGVEKQGEGFFAYAGDTVDFTGAVAQGALEASNVDVTAQMTDMIAATRAFQTCAQVVKTMDEMTAKAAQLGSLR